MVNISVLKKNFVILFLIFAFQLKSQYYNLPTDYFFNKSSQSFLAAKDSSIHNALQPYIHFFDKKYVFVKDSFKIFKYIKDDPALDAMFIKHVINVAPPNENFTIRIDPILNIETGLDFADTIQRRLFTNTRGIIGSGSVGNKVYFETMFAENQAQYVNYISNFAKQSQIIPGQGRWKTFKVNGYDFAFSSGFVSIQALKNFNIQLGHGKHKIGNGYRSLFLSDNAFNYPYLRFTQQWFKGKLQYTNIYASFMNLDSAARVPTKNAERLFQKKAAAFQYLSLNLTKSINVSLFQGLVWKPANDKNKQSITWEYYNPLIFANTAIFGLSNKQTICAGLETKIKFTNSINFYAQGFIQDVKNNLNGFQAGLNVYDLFKVKNLSFTAEFNSVARYSYLNYPDSIANGAPYRKVFGGDAYTHYNQNIAFTPGSGNELLFLLDFRKFRFFGNVKYSYQIRITDNVQFTALNVGYVINPSYNFNVSLGLNYRDQRFKSSLIKDSFTNYFYISVKTNLYNTYFDF